MNKWNDNDNQVFHHCFPLLQLRVIAYDDASPNKIATATVSIYVTRNPNAPVFVGGPYSAIIPETQSLGALVIQTAATDLDQVIL